MKVLLKIGIQARREKKDYLKGLGTSPPDPIFLATFREPEKDESCRTIEEKASLLPPPDLQQALDAAVYERDFCLPPEDDDSDIEIVLGTQYPDPVDLSDSSECVEDGHLNGDNESDGASIESISSLDFDADFITI